MCRDQKATNLQGWHSRDCVKSGHKKGRRQEFVTEMPPSNRVYLELVHVSFIKKPSSQISNHSPKRTSQAQTQLFDLLASKGSSIAREDEHHWKDCPRPAPVLDSMLTNQQCPEVNLKNSLTLIWYISLTIILGGMINRRRLGYRK